MERRKHPTTRRKRIATTNSVVILQILQPNGLPVKRKIEALERRFKRLKGEGETI
jgi:hypothetical protein